MYNSYCIRHHLVHTCAGTISFNIECHQLLMWNLGSKVLTSENMFCHWHRCGVRTTNSAICTNSLIWTHHTINLDDSSPQKWKALRISAGNAICHWRYVLYVVTMYYTCTTYTKIIWYKTWCPTRIWCMRYIHTCWCFTVLYPPLDNLAVW